MSDVHIKYLLARVEMSGSAIAVRGEEGPRNQWAEALDDARKRPTCSYCGAVKLTVECWTTRGCDVRAIEMRKAKR